MRYRPAITLLCLTYFLSMFVTYCVPRDHINYQERGPRIFLAPRWIVHKNQS